MQPSQERDIYPLNRPDFRQFTLLIQDEERRLAVPLSKNFYSIGRNQDRDIQLLCRGVSRYHASLIWLCDSYHIVDGEPGGRPSKNGVFVNKKAVKKKTLKAGDRIIFCKDVYGEIENSLSISQKEKAAPENFPEQKNSRYFTPGVNYLDTKIEADLSLFYDCPDLFMKVDSEGQILNFQNGTDQELPKLSPEQIGKTIFEFFPINFCLNLFKHMRQIEKNKNLRSFEVSLLRNDHILCCEVRIFPGPDSHTVIILRNINQRKVLEQKLLLEAVHDSLTGLPNRALFLEKTAHSVALKQRKKNYEFAVLFVDLDRFKIVNDSLGHLAGDRLLVEISARLKACLRPQDLVARLGGDEFAILLHDIQVIEDAIEVAERIQEKISIPLMLDGREIFPSASIGITFSTDEYKSVEEVIKDADVAMYQAKANGRAKYAVFNPESIKPSLAFLQLDSALKRAIERQEFRLLYQPIFKLKSQKLIGLEALIRWAHPEGELLVPEQFLGQAEETGLTDSIGQWTLQESCRQLREWEQRSKSVLPIILSVNVSKHQFYHSDLINLLRNLIEQYQINASNLKLEITEATIMEDIQTSINIFNCLNKLGIAVLIDDFGTGYSSLNHLHELPIDALKIDRSFISGIDQDASSAGFTIIHSIIDLAHNLGIEVIAEGIECARHMAWLKAFKCDYGQGFYLGKPLMAGQVVSLLETA
ncbi:EAL domain-containing protein [Nodosilinea sp. LEGE 07298]|uniref:EAL domain-containing protein n=1 Tax=Nodosilinea sp. LEGE 07298 TaxID=2777970 RepID=UPI00187E6C5C|nr:EAL domain-containing protein [Nodosilinea sp. LEGE 07298]MBE9110931.1 EAL domain-containing protein [Nodosilinea sp. LEGE 07298]